MIKTWFFNSLFLILILVNIGFLAHQNVMAMVQQSCNSNLQSICDDFAGIEMIKVPSGCFQMGSVDGNWNEEPVHQVRLSGFFLGKYEVTQGQWQKVMGNNPAKFKVGENYPVVGVSWHDVQKFIRKLNSITGRTYRLPSEAEWEYACRSGGKVQKYCGGDAPSQFTWYGEDPSEEAGYHLVGEKLPNGLGLYDMSGNVIEWVQDRYDEDYYQNSPVDNPTGPSDSKQRVLRGGNWSGSARMSRSTVRDWLASNWGSWGLADVGFRLAWSDETPAKQGKTSFINEPCTDDFRGTRGNPIDIEFVKIPDGCFQMGSMNGELDEWPVHEVCIKKPFALGKYEVTQRQWETVMGWNPSKFRKGDNHPVERVSWHKVQAFIRRINEKTGQNYRLPTEAEWEYACRSGGKNQIYCGGNNVAMYAWHGQDKNRGHSAVGSQLPNDLGLYDMSGNVSEWVQDRYDENYYHYSPVDDPKGPSEGSMRILRGSAFYNNSGLRASNRYSFLPGISFDFLGFRLARSLSENEL